MQKRNTERKLKDGERWILALLAEEPLHGYALVDRMEKELDAPRVGVATLYRMIDALSGRGLIETVGPPVVGKTKRRAWGISQEGRVSLRAEAQALATFADRILNGSGP